MKNQNNEYKNVMSNITKLSIIALSFGLAPIILLLLCHIPFIRNICVYLFFVTWWGIYFQIVGLIVGIIALFGHLTKIKSISVSLIVSTIAILSPFIWCCILYYLYNYKGVELFL